MLDKQSFISLTIATAILIFSSSCAKYKVRANGCESPPVFEAFSDGYIAIPNIFTPNGDGLNDYFAIYSRGVSSIEINIKNSVGRVIWYAVKTDTTLNDYEFGAWDGEFNNHGPRTNIYSYTLTYVTAKGNVNEVKGKITVLTASYDQARETCLNHLDQCAFPSMWDGSTFNPLLAYTDLVRGCD